MEKVVEFQLSVGEFLRLVGEPYVAQVGEECSFEDGDYGEAVFEICHELYVADAFEHIVFGRLEVAGAQIAQMPGAYGGGAAAEEALFVGHCLRVAVGDADSGHQSGDECAFLAEVEIVFVFGVEPYVLREGHAEYFADAVLVFLAAGEAGDAAQQVACALDGKVQVVEVGAGAVLLGVVDVVVARVHNEVVAVLVFDARVADALHTAAESAVDVEEVDVGEFERQQLVAVLVVAPVVAEADIAEQALEIAVQLVVGAGIDDGVRAGALPEYVFGEGEEEGRKVEREVDAAFEVADIVADVVVVAVFEYQFGQLDKERTLGIEELGTAKEVLVLVCQFGLEAEIAAHQPIVAAAERRRVVQLERCREALPLGGKESHFGVEQAVGVGAVGRFDEFGVDILEVAQAEE